MHGHNAILTRVNTTAGIPSTIIWKPDISFATQMVHRNGSVFSSSCMFAHPLRFLYVIRRCIAVIRHDIYWIEPWSQRVMMHRIEKKEPNSPPAKVFWKCSIVNDCTAKPTKVSSTRSAFDLVAPTLFWDGDATGRTGLGPKNSAGKINIGSIKLQRFIVVFDAWHSSSTRRIGSGVSVGMKVAKFRVAFQAGNDGNCWFDKCGVFILWSFCF